MFSTITYILTNLCLGFQNHQHLKNLCLGFQTSPIFNQSLSGFSNITYILTNLCLGFQQSPIIILTNLCLGFQQSPEHSLDHFKQKQITRPHPYTAGRLAHGSTSGPQPSPRCWRQRPPGPHSLRSCPALRLGGGVLIGLQPLFHPLHYVALLMDPPADLNHLRAVGDRDRPARTAYDHVPHSALEEEFL